MDLERLQRRLAVEFRDTDLLSVALTHRSAAGKNNERLEYLGDAVLSLIIAEALFEMYPNASEGELSRYRASLVRGETLAHVAKEIDLGDYLRLGSGELKSGGYRRSSILADAMESVIGAIYRDQGLEVAREQVLRLYGTRLSRFAAQIDHKDPKTRLQEYLQARQMDLPIYEVMEVKGQPHEQQFIVECRLTGTGLSEKGKGTSRRRAEQSAARKMLDKLSND